MEELKNLISGDYSIINQKTRFGDMETDIVLRIVTWEGGTENNFENFQKELEELLKKYAI